MSCKQLHRKLSVNSELGIITFVWRNHIGLWSDSKTGGTPAPGAHSLYSLVCLDSNELATLACMYSLISYF